MQRLYEFQPIYSQEQNDNIQSEFKRLQGQHYLDHAGASVYSEKQMKNVFEDLKINLYSNPHARSTSSHLTDDGIDQIRYQILQFFNTNMEEYSVIFTSGATAALKIIAESFEDNEGQLVYLEDNHTSVLGMRAYFKDIVPIPIEKANEIFNNNIAKTYKNADNNINSLLVYPAQSNFSGTKYPLNWIEKMQNLTEIDNVKSANWYCVLDAASYVSNNYLDLSIYKPDFIPISFYKIFGYPTGLGALLVKNTSAHVLFKKYYGGGTVFLALSNENYVVKRKILHERFEDGTANYLSIIALKHGFNTLKELNLSMKVISQHTFNLAEYFYKNLASLYHSNGQPVAIIYSQFVNIKKQGAIVNFNLLRDNGNYIGYSEVLHFANLNQIQLRTGCFCNPGACKFYLKLSTADIMHQFNQGRVCGDTKDLIDGYPTGSIRISLGYMSTKENIDAVLAMIENCFVEKPFIRKLLENETFINNNKEKNIDNIITNTNLEKDEDKKQNINKNEQDIVPIDNNSAIKGQLRDIYLYPIKSCGFFRVSNNWEIVSTGLKYDRQWMIVNSLGICLTQKRNSLLCLIKPEINLKNNVLTLHYEGMKSISIPLDSNEENCKYVEICQSKVCGDKIKGFDCGNEISDWLCEALNLSGLRLLRQVDNKDSRVTKTGESLNLSLSNQAQFLLVNLATVRWLKDLIPDDDYQENIDCLTQRFRPNFVVDFEKSFVEQNLNRIVIDNIEFTFDGQCTRCQMICIDQNTGEKNIEPLKTLSRETGGKISFGIYLSRTDTSRSCIINKNSTTIAQ